MRWRSLEPAQPGSVCTRQKLVEFLAANPELGAVSSHQLRFTLEECAEFRFFPIVSLRHPILRARSIYDYERSSQRREHSDAIHTRKANELGFARFVEWCLSSPGAAGPIASCQTRLCSVTRSGAEMRDWESPVTLTSYLEAVSNLDRASVAIVESLGASLQRIERRLRTAFPHLVLQAGEHAGIAEDSTPANTLAEIRSELGTDLLNRLCQANAHDLTLYERYGGML